MLCFNFILWGLGFSLIFYSVFKSRFWNESHGETNSAKDLHRHKRQTWILNESITSDPELILPTCPCQMENELCLDFHYCYCHMGYPTPLSSITAQPFLKYYNQCSQESSNGSNLPSFDSIPSESPVLSHYSKWDCHEHLLDLLYDQTLYPSLCVQKRRLSFTGTFYKSPHQHHRYLELLKAESHYDFRKTKVDYFWNLPNNTPRRLPSHQKSNARGRGNAVTSSPVSIANGDYFVISGGRWCVETLGVYRRRASFHYHCNVHFYPNPYGDGDAIACDRIRILLNAATNYLYSIQLQSIFHLESNKSLTYNGDERNEFFKPKVIRDMTFSRPRSPGQVCSEELIGLDVKFVHYKLQLLSIEITEKLGMWNKSTGVFPVQMNFESREPDPKYFTNLSRFWYNFYHAICKKDHCWRDILQFPFQEDLAGNFLALSIPFLGIVVASVCYEDF